MVRGHLLQINHSGRCRVEGTPKHTSHANYISVQNPKVQMFAPFFEDWPWNLAHKHVLQGPTQPLTNRFVLFLYPPNILDILTTNQPNIPTKTKKIYIYISGGKKKSFVNAYCGNISRGSWNTRVEFQVLTYLLKTACTLDAEQI